MDIFEKARFFTSVDNILLTVDKPLVNNKVRDVLEGEFISELKKDSYTTYWESMDQLFASLGVLSLYIDAREFMYNFDKDGKVLLTDYGFPSVNKEKISEFRKIQTIEVERVSEKYVEFLSYLFSKKAFCLQSYNYELYDLLHLYDYRYHLNGFIFPKLRERKIFL